MPTCSDGKLQLLVPTESFLFSILPALFCYLGASWWDVLKVCGEQYLGLCFNTNILDFLQLFL